MLEWAKVSGHFAHDGTWRDIIVPDSGTRDWQDFIASVRSGIWPFSYQVNGRAEELPSAVEAIDTSASHLLNLGVLQSGFNCHLWIDSSIELDLVPTDVRTQHDLDELGWFCSRLASIVGKDVLVTPENCPEAAFLRFSSDGQAKHLQDR